MPAKRNRLIFVLVTVVLLASLGSGLGVYWVVRAALQPEAPRGFLPVRLDSRGPYLILATTAAEKSYAAPIAKARQLHPGAAVETFEPGALEPVLERLKQQQPRYALVFIEPNELDVNFAWRWLQVTTRVDDDPLVDVRTGFITGATPQDAERFVERIAQAARGERKLPGRLIDNLGPNTQADAAAFQQTRGSFLLPVYDQGVAVATISHGTAGFSDGRLDALADAGLLHFGGHGYPDRIEQGLGGGQVPRLNLAPCVVFNGACYTGVTGTWYDQFAGGKVARKDVAASECFCLNLLANNAVAYLAALHPDHGVPVYQEMEFLAHSGVSLGDVIKHTHDGVILGAGGELPELQPLAGGAPSPQWTPSEVMLKGTAARVLFGDPALVVGEAFTGPPLAVSVAEGDAGGLEVTAVLANPALKSSYTDTYHADLASNPQLFNDRALIVAKLPAGWGAVGGVEVGEVTAAGKPLRHRLVGWAVEQDGDTRRLHAQVDVPTTGYMQSPFRQEGAKVVLRVAAE